MLYGVIFLQAILTYFSFNGVTSYFATWKVTRELIGQFGSLPCETETQIYFVE